MSPCVYTFPTTIIFFMLYNFRDSSQTGLAQSTINISCSILHGDQKKSFEWSRNQTHSIDIILYEATWKAFIKCLWETDESHEIKYELKVAKGTANNSLEREVIFSAISNKSDSFIISFDAQFQKMKEGTNLPFTMDILESNKTWLFFQGNLSRLPKLPSFSQATLNQSFLESSSNRTLWQFQQYTCSPNIVFIVPANLSDFKKGFPLGFAFAGNQLTVLKWENITLEDIPGVLDCTMKVATQNNILLLYNDTRMIIIPNVSDKSAAQSVREVFKEDTLSTLEISRILSISLPQRCSMNEHLRWFDILALVQLSDKSRRVLMGSSQHQRWQINSLPHWLSLATYIAAQIDFDRRSFFLVANIENPERTMIMVYDLAKADKQELTLTSTPFILDHALRNPKLKLMPKIPAILLHDHLEVWLSTDAGHNFREIFVAQSNEQILHVHTVNASQKDLLIVTTKQVLEYSSFGLRKQSLYSDLDCLATSESLFVASDGDKYTLSCSDSILDSSEKAKKVVFTPDTRPLISSMSSIIMNDFEMEVSMPVVYNSVQDMMLNMKLFCEISKFPDIHLCDAIAKRFDSRALQVSPVIRRFPSCTFGLKNLSNMTYFLTAASRQEGQPCNLWSANMIGVSVILIKTRSTCWVKWLLNDTVAVVSCLDSDPRELDGPLGFSDIAVVDVTGDEKCENTSSQVYPTSSSEVYEINSTSYLVSDHAVKIDALYVRLNDVIGKLSFQDNRTFFTTLGNMTLKEASFKYICFITKKIENDGSKPLLQQALKPCHLSVAYPGLEEDDTFLDANDEAEFNLTLSKIATDQPYLERIPPFAIKPIEPTHVKVQIKSRMKTTPMSVMILIKQKPFSAGTSLLSIHATTQPAYCKGSHKLITIHGACPPGKHLDFEYPIVYSRDTWLYGDPRDHEGFTRLATLPYNYQPPSRLGKAIPLTPNIYNADPSKPMHRASYKVSRDVARYKQCYGKRSRADCGCTLGTTISSKPEKTDCIQRVFKIYFMEKFRPKLFIVDKDGTRTNLEFPYCISELNDRKDYSIEDKVSPGCMSAGKKSALKFDGSGLFHFKVNVIKSGYTFCDLQTYFIIFVADAPMPYPAQELVRAMTSFCFGSIILFVFLINFHLK